VRQLLLTQFLQTEGEDFLEIGLRFIEGGCLGMGAWDIGDDAGIEFRLWVPSDVGSEGFPG